MIRTRDQSILVRFSEQQVIYIIEFSGIKSPALGRATPHIWVFSVPFLEHIGHEGCMRSSNKPFSHMARSPEVHHAQGISPQWPLTRYYWLLLAEGHLNRRRFGGNAEPDRTATDSHGIERSVESAAESVYQGLGGGEVLRKWAGIWGISAMMLQIVDRWGRPAQIEIPVQATRQGRNRSTMARVFEVKKEPSGDVCFL